MEPALEIAFLWLLFGGAHIGLATRRVRGFLAEHLGELGFSVLFSGVALASFAWLVSSYAAVHGSGAAGPALGQVELLRWLLMIAIGASVVLIAGSLAGYPGSPMALFSAKEEVRPPLGLERICRHPMFAGTAVLGFTHALLATHLVGAVFMLGFAVLATLGARHQDAKLLARKGSTYADYLEVTSFVPFAAILSGRQRIVWAELPLRAAALGIAVTFGLRAVHSGIFASGGAWVFGTVVFFGTLATVLSWLRKRRARGLAFAGPP